jgi:hypothetical protein
MTRRGVSPITAMALIVIDILNLVLITEVATQLLSPCRRPGCMGMRICHRRSRA